MIGRGIKADISPEAMTPTGGFDAGSLYSLDVARGDYLGVPQNLGVPPELLNVWNIAPQVGQQQLPPATRQAQIHRLLSRYTFLPVGTRNQMPSGST